MDVMRYPLMTKKTSTPTKPRLNVSNPAWNKITGITATARKPSISARYFNETLFVDRKLFYALFAGDVSALANTLIQPAEDLRLQQRLGGAARAKITHTYTWERTAQGVLSVCQEAANGRN